MLHIKNLDEGLPVFKALGSELRINIVKLLLENREMNMNELASALGITNGALTSHIKKLEESGIIQVLAERGGHGNQKLCRVAVDKILFEIDSDETEDENNIYNTAQTVQAENGKLLPALAIAKEDHKLTSSYGGKQGKTYHSVFPNFVPETKYKYSVSQKLEQGGSGYIELIKAELLDLRIATGHRYDGGISAYLDAVIDMLATHGIPKVKQLSKN